MGNKVGKLQSIHVLSASKEEMPFYNEYISKIIYAF